MRSNGKMYFILMLMATITCALSNVQAFAFGAYAEDYLERERKYVFGVAWNEQYEGDARSRALRRCGTRQCAVQATFRGRCLAIYTDLGFYYGNTYRPPVVFAEFGRNREDAIRNARSACFNHPHNQGTTDHGCALERDHATGRDIADCDYDGDLFLSAFGLQANVPAGTRTRPTSSGGSTRSAIRRGAPAQASPAPPFLIIFPPVSRSQR